jgi:hypothetical protein
VSAPANEVDPRPPKRRLWKRVLGGLLLLFLLAAAWIAISRNPYAQGLRAIFGRTPDQVILDRTFSVGAHGFRFYKFSLPEGASNMAVAGQFSVASDAAENTIEVLVLSEEELAKWQTGSVARCSFDLRNRQKF